MLNKNYVPLSGKNKAIAELGPELRHKLPMSERLYYAAKRAREMAIANPTPKDIASIKEMASTRLHLEIGFESQVKVKKLSIPAIALLLKDGKYEIAEKRGMELDMLEISKHHGGKVLYDSFNCAIWKAEDHLLERLELEKARNLVTHFVTGLEKERNERVFIRMVKFKIMQKRKNGYNLSSDILEEKLQNAYPKEALVKADIA